MMMTMMIKKISQISLTYIEGEHVSGYSAASPRACEPA